MFVTPLLKAGKFEEALGRARVTGEVGRAADSFAGYFTVNKALCNSNLFFWFFPASVRREHEKRDWLLHFNA